MNRVTLQDKILWLTASFVVAFSLIITSSFSSSSQVSNSPASQQVAVSDSLYHESVPAPVSIPVQPQPASQFRTPQIVTVRRAPGQPSITHLSEQDGTPVVHWQAPTNGGSVDYYQVQWRLQNSGSSWTQEQHISSDVKESILTYLESGNAYEVAVRAVNSSGSYRSVPTIVAMPGAQPSIGKPFNVQVDTTSENDQTLSIYWEEPVGNISNPPVQYLIQWRKSYEAFSGDRQSTFLSSAVTPAGDGSDRAFSVTITDPDAYKIRVVAVDGSAAAGSAEALIYTPTNEIRYSIEELLVGQYEDDHPWLTETWNYINKPNFAIKTTESTVHASVQLEWYSGSPLNYTGSNSMQFNADWSDDESYLGLYTHEMVHVYTLSNNLAARPGSIGIGYLYFSKLANASGASDCKPSELYADAGKYTIFPEDYSNYWDDGCPTSDSQGPTEEAVEVARQAFRGNMPDWFYETYQRIDGSLDLEAIWAEVKAIESDWYRTTVIYQLRSEFGGYCDAADARESAGGNLDIDNPWRDGGCYYRDNN